MSVTTDSTEVMITEERKPLLLDNQTPIQQRLVSLDVFRGFTVLLMILVDNAGGAFPSINHSPWFGVTLADFVMPFFLFAVGISVALVFKRVDDKRAATKKVILRSIKLFLLGIVLQGGYVHGHGDLTYGVDITKMRLMGVLQRISIGYMLASVAEIWLVNNIVVDTAATFTKKYYKQWMIAILLGSLYMCLLYGLYVPNWKFEVSSSSWTSLKDEYTSQAQIVQCGMRGSLEPPCNAVGLVDRILIGEHHLYKHPVYRRTQDCSVNSPDYGPLPPNFPGWCLAPFEPEGILSSLMAAVTCFVGLHFGHIIVHFECHKHRVILWSISASFLLTSGFFVALLGVPLSKPLYTLSYMCVTAGASGFLLTIFFYIVDVKKIRKPVALLQWVGMNALTIYALAACDILTAFVQGFYWRLPENNLISVLLFFVRQYIDTTHDMDHTPNISSGENGGVTGHSNILDSLLYNLMISEVDGAESLLQIILQSRKWGTAAFVALEILFWGLFAGFLNKKRLHIKL
ncbi:uncharacterized protein LOC108220276 isoform X1 [Daucus carota subsp. sativus]|uniref:uncharacterized protein LOC108220276 isoform X1 n=1 Tax=Daucus carota subsp. sativus TaxID=79200 RepID=UPI0007EFAF68|nr:PREDICTED: heparan-alpha-glucosaminide N-acetyltransferase-like isoform X1 [Daucus carota subsp. sativus]